MRTRAFSRAMAGGLCTVLVLGGATVIAAGPAAAASCDPGNPSARSDIDGDGLADVVVGTPQSEYGSAVGAVDIRTTGSPSVLLTAKDLGKTISEPDEFGYSIAVGDLDQDGCADLVIGSPYEAQTRTTDGRSNEEGQVRLVFGKVGGVDTSTSILLPHDSGAGDNFGRSVALQARYDTATGKTVHDLYVGSPKAEANGKPWAGAVFRYTIAPSTTGRVTTTLREVRTQDSPGVPGTAESGDQFGHLLATTDTGGVLVGDPFEDVGSVRNSGAIWFLRVNEAGAPISSQMWSQNSPGVPGHAESEDNFGSALSSRGLQAVVGVPGEDVGSQGGAGMIQVFNRTSATGAFTPGKAIYRKSRGVPGRMEANDRFGSAVAVGAALLCPESTDVAVGVPGADVGRVKNAGSIILLHIGGAGSCSAKVLRQGSGLAGKAELYDEVGSVLSLTRGRNDLEEDYADRLLVGVPEEGIGPHSTAGLVQPVSGGLRLNGVVVPSLTYSKDYLRLNEYGNVLSSASD